MSFIDNTGNNLWDLSHPTGFSQLPDDDFLTLLSKQFSTPISQDIAALGGVNPQNISQYPLPSLTPPSEDSSPSPPNHNDSPANDDQTDTVLKRKASEGDFDDESPSSKAQHTTNSTKKTTTTARRKSTGAAQPKDETRLLKRKEQNRAAQRAFRERKEKHVKDLEDKVAALEAKNEAATAENENLRDLLGRLQQENMTLRQSSFTFSVPKTGPNSTANSQASTSFASQSSDFSAPSTSRLPTPPTAKMSNPLDWSSLTTFDPNMLNLLDDSPQPTATDGAMSMDFGFGTSGGLRGPLTTIASNPMFMSYASAFDSPLPLPQQPANETPSFDVDWSTFSSTWPSPPAASQDTPSLDDILAGYLGQSPNYSYLPSTSSITSESPVTHHANPSALLSAKPSPHSFSSSSSPSSSSPDPLFDTPRESSASESEQLETSENQRNNSAGSMSTAHKSDGCPRTRGELAERIYSAGSSPFAWTPLRKGSDDQGPVILCEGTGFSQTPKSDKNIEIMSALKSVQSKYKEADINVLCSEFTSKAKCDGTKLVLEPQEMTHIMQNLSAASKK
ncbi:hypothetical protein H0H92_008706 [Tricholoma furcatifolium]|nr:hypothetical protein H0H92_008706 [Tricholoma furcatifolium]